MRTWRWEALDPYSTVECLTSSHDAAMRIGELARAVGVGCTCSMVGGTLAGIFPKEPGEARPVDHRTVLASNGSRYRCGRAQVNAPMKAGVAVTVRLRRYSLVDSFLDLSTFEAAT